MPPRLEFPRGFLWGAATSAHQVEGGNRGSDWWAWERAGRNPSGDASGEACDHYRRFDDDFALAASLGHTAHRFSIEWSRVEPQPGQFDAAAIDHYKNVLESLSRHRIVPVVTLWHFTLPQWVARLGGWENPNTVRWFARYVAQVATLLGSAVPYWCTVNEPNVYLLHGYFLGIWPPQRRSIVRCIRVHRALVRAHRTAAAVLRNRFGNRTAVGFAGNFNAFEADRPGHVLDRTAARVARFIWNEWFARQVARDSDFIGVNYYFSSRVRFAARRPDLFFADIRDGAGEERSDLGWKIDPAGFERTLVAAARFGKPILVMENGIADADDSRRSRFIADHLAALHSAMENGADVRGYLHWSLLDNYEWAHGFLPRFGLVAVDYATQRRTPRPSALQYRDIIRANAVPAPLLAHPGESRYR